MSLLQDLMNIFTVLLYFSVSIVMAFISVESRQMISAGIESYASDAMKNLLAQARTSLLGLSFQ